MGIGQTWQIPLQPTKKNRGFYRMISMDKMDNYRETLEELLYNITVFSLSKRGLTLDEIEENFILSIYTVFEMIKMQDENLT